MLPAIGIITGSTGIVIALYVFTRMAAMVANKEVKGAVSVFAALTAVTAIGAILVVLLMMADLVIAGVTP